MPEYSAMVLLQISGLTLSFSVKDAIRFLAILLAMCSWVWLSEFPWSIIITTCFDWGCIVLTYMSLKIKWHSFKWLFNYSWHLLSRSWRDPLKHFEISVLRHIRFGELRKIPMEQPNFANEHVIWLLWLENICGKYCGKGEKLLLRSNFSSYPQNF